MSFLKHSATTLWCYITNDKGDTVCVVEAVRKTRRVTSICQHLPNTTFTFQDIADKLCALHILRKEEDGYYIL